MAEIILKEKYDIDITMMSDDKIKDKIITYIICDIYESAQLMLEVVNLRMVHNPEDILFVAVTWKAPKEIFDLIINKFNKNNISLEHVNKYNQTVLDNALLHNSASYMIISLIKGGANYQRKIPNWDITHLQFYLNINKKHEHIIRAIQACIEQRETSTWDQIIKFTTSIFT